MTTILLWAIFALSLDFVMGYARLFSLGHAMFWGIGAYSAALIMLHISPSILIAVMPSIILCAVVAWVVGALSVRVSGIYFAMITLAFAQLFYNLAYKFEWTGSSDGLLGFTPFLGIGDVGMELSGIELIIGPLTITPTITFYYLALVLSIASYIILRRIIRAPFGSVLKGIRESEERVQFIGYNTDEYKRRAFVISGTFAGLAGYAHGCQPE